LGFPTARVGMSYKPSRLTAADTFTLPRMAAFDPKLSPIVLTGSYKGD